MSEESETGSGDSRKSKGGGCSYLKAWGSVYEASEGEGVDYTVWKYSCRFGEYEDWTTPIPLGRGLEIIHGVSGEDERIIFEQLLESIVSFNAH